MTKKMTESRAELRTFGLFFGGVAAILAVYLFAKQSSWWPYAAGSSGMFAVLGLLFPAVLRPLHHAWMRFAHVLAWINTRVLLTIFFYLVMTPTGVVMRLLGKDFLHERLDRDAQSYWVKRDRAALPRERYERLF